MSTIGAVVMAAGSSVRFGSDKRLYDDGNGPLLQQTLSHVLALHLPVQIVLRAQDKPGTDELLGTHAQNPTLDCFFVSQPELGIGHNLAAFFQQPPTWDGAMVFLADMPWIQPATSALLLEQFDECAGEKVIAPQIEGRRGHPVLFPRHLFKQLAQCSGDQGANTLLKELVKCSPSMVLEIPVEDKGVTLDLDSLPR